MTLSLARNFLLLPWHERIGLLKDLKLLDADELDKLIVGNHDESIVFYQTAFRRANERKQVKDLEHAVQVVHKRLEAA